MCNEVNELPRICDNKSLQPIAFRRGRALALGFKGNQNYDSMQHQQG